jgi:hypothetical protein
MARRLVLRLLLLPGWNNIGFTGVNENQDIHLASQLKHIKHFSSFCFTEDTQWVCLYQYPFGQRFLIFANVVSVSSGVASSV